MRNKKTAEKIFGALYNPGPIKKLLLTAALFLLVTSQAFATTVNRTVTNCSNDSLVVGSLAWALAGLPTGISDSTNITFNITTAEAGYSTGPDSPGLVTNEADGCTWFRIIFGGVDTDGHNISINGSSQPVGEANNPLGPRVEIRGGGFMLRRDSCTINGLVINGDSIDAIEMGAGGLFGPYSTNFHIYGCYIGTTATGEAAAPGRLSTGIKCSGSLGGGRIGGPTAAERNVISNCDNGIFIGSALVSSTEVYGNYIGTNSNGTRAITNSGWGIRIDNPGFGTGYNKIGGKTTTPGTGLGNLISGNVAGGVWVYYTDQNKILGNLIGTNASGTGEIGNGTGVSLSHGVRYNKIGDGTWQGRNVISGNSADGINISGNSGGGATIYTSFNEILGNYIGTTISGEAKLGNNTGVKIADTARYNTIGNGTSEGRNIISGNTICEVLVTDASTTGNNIIGNYIGTTASGEGAFESADEIKGIKLANGSLSTDIGNGTLGGRNLISGNSSSGNPGNSAGIWIDTSNGNSIRGNYIGTNKDGTRAIKNDSYGIVIYGSQRNQVGGPGTWESNLISGNGSNGIMIYGAATSNSVEGNYIGVKANGTESLPNGAGVLLYHGAYGNFIGGTAPGEGNVISGNSTIGVIIGGGNSVYNNYVLGNFIGTDNTGLAALPNAGYGIMLRAPGSTCYNNYIGNGTTAGRNIISGNGSGGGFGIYLTDTGTDSNEVLGNYIGLGADGSTSVPNNGTGIYLASGPKYNKIGNGAAGGVNVISGNALDGITINGPGSDRNEINKNYIGTDPGGTTNKGNAAAGVNVSGGAAYNKIGPNNIIAYNGGTTYPGIKVVDAATTSETITQNSIFNNYDLGISLEGGSNQGIPDPVILSAGDYDTTLTVTGTSQAGALVEVFMAQGNQGKTYLGSGTADGSGSWIATIEGQSGLTSADSVTATQTGTEGSTSQFAGTREVTELEFGKPDNMVGLNIDGSDYRYAGTIESTPLTQVQSKEVLTNQKAVAYFKFVNLGNIVDNFRVSGDASSTSFEVKYFDAKTNGFDITDGVTLGAIAPAPFTPGATAEMRVEVTYSGTTLATKEITLTASSTFEPNNKDAVKAVMTFIPLVYKPDNMVGLTKTGTYETAGIFEDSPLTQVQSREVVVNQTAVAYFRIVNAGNTIESFRVSGDASSGSFEVKYFDSLSGTNEITDAVTLGAIAPVLFTVGASAEMRVEVTYNDTTLATKEITLTVSSTIESDKKDAVKAVMTFVPKNYQPDNMVGKTISGEYLTPWVYEDSAAAQVQSKEVVADQKAVAYFKIRNTGNSTDSFIVSGDASSGDFDVRYFDSMAGTHEITDIVTSGAVAFASVPVNATAEMRVEVAYSGTALATKEINLTAYSTNETGKKDAVRADLTFVSRIYRPDNMVGTLESGEFRYWGTYETTPNTQVLSKEVLANQTAVAYFRIRNSGNTVDSLRLSGEASGGGFGIKYFYLGEEITDSVTSGAVVFTNVPAISTLPLVSVEVTYSGTTLATKEITLIVGSATESDKVDAVKAVLTFGALTYQPDNMIGLKSDGTDYLTEGLYETTPVIQVKSKNHLPSETSKIYFKVKNAGNTPNYFKPFGTGSGDNFTIKYYDAKTGTNEITDQVVNTHAPLPLLAAGQSLEMRAEVTYSISTYGSKEFIFSVSSEADTTKMDAVKAIITFLNDSPRIVTNCSDSAEVTGSLRWAMTNMSSNTEIMFNITTAEAGYSTGAAFPGLVTKEAGAAGKTWFRIITNSPIATTANYIAIRGSTQPSGEANNSLGPKVEIRSSHSGNVIDMQSTSCTIEGLAVNRNGGNNGNGINLLGDSNYASVYGCYVGTTATGEAAPNRFSYGVNISASYCNIGGSTEVERNVISNNSTGILLLGITGQGTKITGNYIGTNRTGTKAIANTSYGINVYSSYPNATIGGLTTTPGTGLGNLISGNTSVGILLQRNGSTVIGNLIGTNATGTAAIANVGDGVRVLYGSNKIGNGQADGRNVISGNGSIGVNIYGSGVNSNEVLGNYIGTTISGEAKLGNVQGVAITTGAQYNKVGNSTDLGRNIISGNSLYGVTISDLGSNSNEVIGNFIGTTSTGEARLNNSNVGVRIRAGAAYNKVGNGTAGGLNVISGQTDNILITDSSTNNNKVLGNYIGTTKNGNSAIEGNGYGVRIDSAAKYNKVGDGQAGGRNVISGNGTGISINGSNTNSNEVLGNYIGVDLNGTSSVPNTGNGIRLTGAAKYNKIGSTTSSIGNVISGNGSIGIAIYNNGTNGNEILGNYIGTDKNGVGDLGNNFYGIYISDLAVSNKIGNGSALGRNVIGFNNNTGILLSNGTGTEIFGNYIGLGADGIADCGNGQFGIYISTEASFTKVGSTADAGYANYISGNDTAGIYVKSAWTNDIAGNYIGLQADKTTALGNTQYGIRAETGARSLTVGPSNYIANNGDGPDRSGVLIKDDTTYGIKVTRNYIYSNLGYGISLEGGANYGITDPVISSSVNRDTTLTVVGTSQASSLVEIFKAQGNQGKTYLGNTTADGSGNWTATIEGSFTTADSVTATQTGTQNSTSQFSATREVTILDFGKPDNMVGLSATGSDYRWAGTVESTPLTQVQTREVLVNQTAVAYFKLVNAGNIVDNFRVTGDASSASFEVKYFDSITGTNEITDTITSGAVSPQLTVGASAEIRVEVTYSGTTMATKEITLTASSTYEPASKDAVKAVMRFIPLNYQPDNMVGLLLNGSDYKTEGIWETTPAVQVQNKGVATNETAVIYFKVKNAGNTTDYFIPSGTGSDASFAVTYYNAKTGGTDFTDQIVNTHAPSPVFNVGSSMEFRAEVSYSGTAIATKELTLTITSSTDGLKKDAVKAVITFAPIPNPTPSNLDHFDVSAPTSVVSGNAFSVTVTAKDSAGATLTGIMTGTTLMTVDSGSVSPTSLDAAAFSSGVWTGSVTLNMPGMRTITVSNGTKAGTAMIATMNSSKDYPAGSFAGAPAVSVFVPAGAATADVSVSVSEVVSPASPPAGFSAGGKTYSFTAGSVSTFLVPLTITIPLDSALKAPEVRYWDGTNWSSAGITIVSYTSTTITFTTTHFTTFIPLGTIASNLVRFGPNPYNPNSGTSAQIWYWLDANADTSIYIIDLSGTVVWKQSYLSGTAGGLLGANNIAYNGTTAGGDILGNGVYLYKIIQGGKPIGGGKIAVIK